NAVEEMGEPAAPYLPCLQSLLLDEDAGVRLDAMSWLARRPDPTNETEALLGAAVRSDPNPLVRSMACSHLRFLAREDPQRPWRFILGLVAMLEDSDSTVRRVVLSALADLKPTDTADLVGPALARIKVEQDFNLFLAWLQAIGALGPAAVPHLTPQLRS